ncbi:uncharacterized protein [Aegilops tauschii subsp. strangulata]|uniref:uncharacterized protein n=1 Tax=Aegilops tauschii subsp. strangulata TaxID=200361 RepID=UPI00098A169F|nr:uncharacterized protein LOC109757039 [Aegilops tauschii subsp. strangulata]
MDSDLEYIYEQYVESSDGSSDEEYSNKTTTIQVVLEDVECVEERVLNFKGSIKDHRVLNRNRGRGHLTLMADYFALNALFTDNFRRRFRMRKTVFDHLYHGVRSYDGYFILKKDVVGMIGFSGYHKCTPALRMLADGTTADSYLRMSETTCGDAMVRFATVVVEVFGPQYLREPTVADTERLLAILEARGWPGLLGSLDCMH